jgi:hypothetical protein
MHFEKDVVGGTTTMNAHDALAHVQSPSPARPSTTRLSRRLTEVHTLSTKNGCWKVFANGMVVVSLTLFVAISAIIIAADQGQWQLWGDNTPAHFIFVGQYRYFVFL